MSDRPSFEQMTPEQHRAAAKEAALSVARMSRDIAAGHPETSLFWRLRSSVTQHLQAAAAKTNN
ncbi:MAG: hypothetical protein AAFR65_10440 [Pseudomonadota bacterium]